MCSCPQAPARPDQPSMGLRRQSPRPLRHAGPSTPCGRNGGSASLPIASMVLVEKAQSLTGCNYATDLHVRASGRERIPYPLAVIELPSDGQGQRITNAVDAAYPGTKEVGTRGQATKVHRRMEELFAERTPHFTTVLRWIEDPGRLTIDAIYMIACAVGADPVTVAFGDLTRRTPVESEHSETESSALLRAAERFRRPPPPPENPADEQRGGRGA
jgi:hypothetical protein